MKKCVFTQFFRVGTRKIHYDLFPVFIYGKIINYTLIK